MKLDTGLDDIYKAVALCLKDGMCTYGKWPENYSLCPIYNRYRVFTASAGGFMYIIRALADNRIRPTSTMIDFAYECTTCQACDVCEVVQLLPPYAPPSDLIRFLRYQLVKQGAMPGGKIKQIYEQLQQGKFWGKKVSLKLPENIKDDNANTVLFVEASAEGEIHESAIGLLEKIGRKVSLFDVGSSCGCTLYNLGFWDELNLFVKQTGQLKKLSGKVILFTNPHCQEFMVKRYPEIAPEQEKIMGRHFSEFLLEALETGRLRVNKGQHIKVSYHDPCYLGRGLGIYEAPRKVISTLDGVELIEMERNRGNSYCCGAGGVSGALDFSKLVAQERIAEFKETGADLLITAYPYCKEAFRRVLPAEERGRIKDVIELVNERTQ